MYERDGGGEVAVSGGRRRRRTSRMAAIIAVAIAVVYGVVPASAAPIDTTSTTGVHILTIPTPDRLYELTPGEPPVPFHPPLPPVAMAGDLVVMNDPLDGDVLVWDGNGYPTSIADDFPVDALASAEDVNSTGTVVGGVITGGQARGFAWSEAGGFVDVGDPPGSIPDVASDPSGFGPQVRVTGVAESGWIVGSFRAEAGVCSIAVNACGFYGVPDGAGYDLTPFTGLFSPEDIELVTLGAGAPEHMAVGSPSGVWTETGGIAALDDGGTGALVTGFDLNQSGEIVGSLVDSAVPEAFAAYWPSPGGAVTTVLAGGYASAIGEDGTVVGTAGFAFSWRPGDASITDLGNLPGASMSEAYAVNGSRQIAGTSNGIGVIFDLTGSYDIDYPPHIDLAYLDAEVEAGQVLEYEPVISDLDGDAWVVTWEGLPTGAVWSDGTLTWPTSDVDVGIHTVAMTVSAGGDAATASSADVTLEVAGRGVADLAIEVLEPGPSTDAVVGEPVPFVFDVTNLGPSTATSVLATVDVPDGAVVEQLDPSCGFGELGSTVACTIESLDGTQRFALTVRFPSGGDVAVDLGVGADQVDPDLSNNAATVLVRLTATVADLAIRVVEPTAQRFLAETAIPFVLAVENLGPDVATGVVAEIDFPVDATVSDLDGGCIDPPGAVDVACDLGAVAGTQQFGFSASFADPGQFTVDATVTGEQSDPDLTNNAVFAGLEILGQADLLDPIGDQSISPLADLEFTVTSVATAPAYRVRWMNPPGAVPTLTLPDGMSATRVGSPLEVLAVSWTPAIRQVGVYEFEFAVVDEHDPDNPVADSEIVTIVVQGTSFRGVTWADLDEDGTRLGPTGQPEPLLAGVTVYIDEDDNGSLDDGEPAATTVNGSFIFPNQAPVGHEFVVRQQLPADFVQTTPSRGDGIRLTLLDPTASVQFGSRPVDPTAMPQVFGTVWNDVDCDRDDRGESGVVGARVRIERLGLDGVYVPEATVFTRPDGSYAFAGLPDGTYRVHLDVPDGFEHTSPGSTSTAASYQIGVDGTVLHGGRDFGVAASETCRDAIYGTLWHDVDRNGLFDADEEPLDLSFASVWLDTDDDGRRDLGEQLGYVVGPGRYRIQPVAPGNHIVRSAIPSTFPIRTAPGGDHSYLVALVAGETVSGIDFGFATDDDPDDRPPVIQFIPDRTVIVGDVVEVEIVASDPEGDPFTLSLGTNPGGEINAGSYVWDTLDVAPGTYRVTVYATQDDDPSKVGLAIVRIEVLTPGGDEDGDGIANAIDGYVAVSFRSQAKVASIDFTDQHREGPLPDGAGTTFGIVSDGPELLLSDTPDPAVGVRAVNGPASANVWFCGNTRGTLLAADSTTDHTCGSHTMTVLAGSASLETSDGARIDVTAGSSVKLDDDGGPVVVTVLTGSVTVTVGGNSTVLDETDPVLTDPGYVLGDDDDDGLTNAEEAATRTDPADPDTDGDGVIDSLDASWLLDHLDGIQRDYFGRRFHRIAMKLTIAAAAVAVKLGWRDLAVEIVETLDRRIDGCGDGPDRSDWITDCDTQVEFRELLALYHRGISTLPLPWPS